MNNGMVGKIEEITEDNTSEEIGELVKALAKVQGSINLAKRDSTNPFFKSKYADLTSVWDSCRKELSQNGLVVIQTTKNDNERVVVLTRLAHESGQWIRGEISLRPVKNDPQGYGSALTYARRYSLAAIVGIATGEDDDAEDATRGKQKDKVKTTYVGNKVKRGKTNFVETGIKLDATNQAEKNEIEKVEKLGKKEVKDEPKILSEEEAQKEQAKLLDTGNTTPDYGGRNKLNIRWHTLRKKLVDINFFSDDASYREWLNFSFKVKSSKELSDKQMSEGIELMAKIYNKHSREKK